MTGFDRKIDLMLKHNINAEQWFFLELIWIAQNETEGSLYLYKYYSERAKMNNTKPGLDKHLLDDLVQKDIIKSYSEITSAVDLDDLQLNLGSEFFIDLQIDGLEFWDEYPKLGEIDGKMFPLTNISKRYDSMEDFLAYYAKAINFDPELHKKNMTAVRKAKKHNLINYSIVEWVTSRKWNDFKEVAVDLGDDI